MVPFDDRSLEAWEQVEHLTESMPVPGAMPGMQVFSLLEKYNGPRAQVAALEDKVPFSALPALMDE
jgi:hypothetical protein